MDVPPTPVARGLDGVIVEETSICLADKQSDTLSYRGYAIDDLAERSTYEEVAYLLIYGELPDATQLASYRRDLVGMRTPPPSLLQILTLLPAEADPMDVLRTSCSALGTFEPEKRERPLSDIGNRLIACMPSLLMYWYHYHHSGKMIDLNGGEETVSGNLLQLLHGVHPPQSARRAMDVSLIVYAEHDFNASTFAALVTTSTLSDAYSAFVSAIGTLRGPLHGSANASVLRFMSKFKSVADAEAAVREMLAAKSRVPGFGQRAYSRSDPRNSINKALARKLCEEAGDMLLYDIANRIEEVLQERKMFANLDYYTAIIYSRCGLPVELFAPMFFIARIPGLVAHIAEQRANNRLIHPSSRYIGPSKRSLPNLNERSPA
jgi:2-methylcitrate synthase